MALGAALLFAGSVTLTKFITRRDSALTVIFLMFAMQSVIGAVPAWLTWTTPLPDQYIWIAIVALAGTGSHYCLSKAISLADATVVMPMDFLRLPLTALLGYLIYSEAIDMWSVIGGADDPGRQRHQPLQGQQGMTGTAQSQHRLGLWLVAAAALAWSSAGIFTRLIQADLMTMLFWRGIFSGSAVFLLFLFLERGKALSILQGIALARPGRGPALGRLA